ncbi:cyclase family protein [Candidatus Woesearchaeota archaeon]|nr:cyclase family protein [Candidatus Woesearchaeota archaeon]
MIIDLTMLIDETTPVYPGDPKQEIRQIAAIKKEGYNEKRVAFNSHFSTHIDAPFHMLEDGKTLTDFPIETFVGDAVVIDVRDQREITEDLENIGNCDIVFFYTGHTEKRSEAGYFENNPVLSKATILRLIKKNVRIVGIDSFSPDNAPWPLHKLLFKNDILIVENLVDLEKVAGKKFKCYILPLKIKDADGAPCRVIAVL